MADVNVSVVTIDSGMDCFERIQDAIANYQKVVLYDIKQLGSSIQMKIYELNRELSALYDNLSQADDEDEREEIRAEIRTLQARLERMHALKRKQAMVAQTYKEQSTALVANVNEKVSSGVRDMATYLRHIAGVDEGGGSTNGVNVFSGDSNYTVVIIDSQKYPESAEHIKVAVKEGHPAMLTLNRSGADENRRQSLAGIPERSYADRDEYPPASFSEGGQGAHVAYIDSSDNRGSGSSFRWQLSGVPDGTRVRFRVI
jgi:Skp family chaperone for outer membrane proteins